MNRLIELDKNFSEATFKTNVDNVFIQLLMGIMMKDLEPVKHFISEELYSIYTERVNELKEKNQTQLYDELNVKSTEIVEVEILDDKFVICVKIISRYMDYILSGTSGRVVSGDNTRRVEKNNLLTFEKKRTDKQLSAVRKCASCGANMDINHSGKCEYCGTIFNLEEYDYILTKIVTL